MENVTVLLHPSAMMQCGMTMGGLCMVADEYILHSWPVTSLGPGNVQVPQELSTLLDKPHVPVRPYRDSGDLASEVWLSPRYDYNFYAQK